MRCINQKGANSAIRWPQMVGLKNTTSKNFRSAPLGVSPLGRGSVGNSSALKKLPHNSPHCSALRVPVTSTTQIPTNKTETNVARMTAAVCVNANNRLTTPLMNPATWFTTLWSDSVLAGWGLVEVAVITAFSSFFAQPVEDIGQFALFGVGALQ